MIQIMLLPGSLGGSERNVVMLPRSRGGFEQNVDARITRRRVNILVGVTGKG